MPEDLADQILGLRMGHGLLRRQSIGLVRSAYKWKALPASRGVVRRSRAASSFVDRGLSWGSDTYAPIDKQGR